MLTNGDLGELLWTASQESRITVAGRSREASRAAHFWAEEAGAVAAAGRSLTETVRSGPGSPRVSGRGSRILPVPEPDERGADASRTRVRRVARRRSGVGVDAVRRPPDAHDLGDGGLPLEEMVEAARSLGRPTSRSPTTRRRCRSRTAWPRTGARRAGRAIDAMNAAFDGDGDAFRVLRSQEVDLFPDGSIDMDDDSLGSLDLVLGAFHSALRSRRTRPSCRRPRPAAPARARAGRMRGRRAGSRPTGARVRRGDEAGQGGRARRDPGAPGPHRRAATIARQEGVEWFSIGSDAHTALELEFLPFDGDRGAC